MTYEQIREWLRQYWFWAALLLAIVFGYEFGKDRALTENLEERGAAIGNGPAANG